MDSNENRVQKHVVPNSPGEGSEVKTGRGSRESGLSRGTIIKVVILAVAAIVAVLFALSISDKLVSIGDRTGLPILDGQESSTLSFVAWIGIGLVIGFIGSKILNTTGRALRRDCLLGI